MKLWDKGSTLDTQVEQFTVGQDRELDRKLAPWDALASIAHARMLAEVGLLKAAECAALTKELQSIYRRAVTGEFVIEEHVEDVHSQIEFCLTRKLGECGKKIHTGRSRNDQVLVDIKLFMRAEILDLADELHALALLLLRQGQRYRDVLLPGYTHTQIAMPSSFGLWFSAWAESLAEDMIPLHAAYRIANRNPLGSAAGYGSGLPIDRRRTSALLGFEAPHINVVNAQLSRGKSERIVAAALADIAATLARLAADVCLYMCPNLNFLSLPPDLATGSSIMPHKQNPDVFELIRAHCNRLQALPNQIAMLCTNLSSGYHRDYQLLKESIIPAFGTLRECLRIARHALAQVRIREGIMQEELYRYAFTVEAVNRQVCAGIPFRDAYHHIAQSVAAGSFSAPEALEHTHLGSIGNPGFAEIRAFLEREAARFERGPVEAALAGLLNETA